MTSVERRFDWVRSKVQFEKTNLDRIMDRYVWNMTFVDFSYLFFIYFIHLLYIAQMQWYNIDKYSLDMLVYQDLEGREL